MLDDHDHRSLGRRLDLFHQQDDAPGMVFWHPRGMLLYRLLEDAIRRRVARDGFAEVRSPQILRQAIWVASGHWQNFRDGMFVLEPDDGVVAAVKPVSCPGHLEIVRAMAPSYRDLPIRLAEFGLVHRNEPSGTLHGLFRLRQFVQDDGHVFLAERDVRAEVARFCESLAGFYRALGFDAVDAAFSSRPVLRAGSDAVWDRAEAMLRDAAASAGLAPVEQPGHGAFYGPKLEFVLRDRVGRAWQCGTIQLDLVLPERFDVSYVDAAGERQRPAMLHRALLGSLERFLGILLEHYEGALPAWLAPDQVLVAPLASAFEPYAREVAAALRAAGLRAELARGDERLARRVADAHERGVPYLVAVGQREAAARTIAVRQGRGGDAGARWVASLDDGARELVARCAPPPM